MVSRVKNIHFDVTPPGSSQHVSLVKGDYEYWHYCCDGDDDRGWGCGYRTLQTVCSWIRLQDQQSKHLLPSALRSNIPQHLHFPAQNTRNIELGIIRDMSKSENSHADDAINDDAISVIASGDNSTSCDGVSDGISNLHHASACRTDSSVTYGNEDRAENKEASITCKAARKSTSCCPVESADDIVVLSSGNINSNSENDIFRSDIRVQDTYAKKSESSCSSVISHEKQKNWDLLVSSVDESRTRGAQLPADPKTVQDVPSLLEIQRALVQIGDKPSQFLGSRQWIGSYEVCLCLDFFYDVPCKIVHISQGSDLGQHLSTLQKHFSTLGSPVMMGGDSDASSKGIVGVCTEPGALLVVDPHYSGKAKCAASLQKAGWVKWILLEDFHPASFYNICMPQLAARSAF